MSESTGVAAGPLARLVQCVDEILALDHTRADVADLRSLAQGIEAQLSRLGYAQLLAFAELDRRNIVGELQLRGLADFIVAELRCTRATAKAKLGQAEQLCAGRSLTGEPIEAVHPTVGGGPCRR